MKRNYSTTRSEGVCNPRFDTRSKSYVGQDTHISLLKGDRQLHAVPVFDNGLWLRHFGRSVEEFVY